MKCASHVGERDPERGFAFFRPGGARRQTEVMKELIEEHHDFRGAEPSLIRGDLSISDEEAPRALETWQTRACLPQPADTNEVAGLNRAPATNLRPPPESCDRDSGVQAPAGGVSEC